MTARTPPPATPDSELIERVYQQDTGAFEILYDRHGGYVMALALKLVGDRNEADEIVQDVFWQLWSANVRFDSRRGRFTTWLFAITRSRALDRLQASGRRTDRLVTTDPVDLADEARGTASENPERDAYTAERRGRVRDALAELPAEQRKAVELCFFNGLTHREAASRLEEPLGTVKSRIKLGMDKLRASLAGAFEGET